MKKEVIIVRVTDRGTKEENNFNRQIMEKAGSLYRQVKENLKEEIDISIVDPKNFIYLIPKIIIDGIKNKRPMLEIIKTLFTHPVPCIFCEGQVIFKKEIPTFEEFKIKIIKEKL